MPSGARIVSVKDIAHMVKPHSASYWVTMLSQMSHVPDLTVMQKLQTDIKQLNEQIDWLMRAVHDMKKMEGTINDIKKILEAMQEDENVPDNYDMTAEQIKNLILEKYDLSKPTYPSDVAEAHGLDYDEVLKAVDLLRKECRVVYDR